jgi:DNA-binding transcriptional MocR family regulator
LRRCRFKHAHVLALSKQQPESFRASALYLAGRTRGHSPERVEYVEACNLQTTDPNGAALAMDATAAKSARCRQPAYHFIITFDPKDAAAGKVTPEVKRQVADAILRGLAQDRRFAQTADFHPAQGPAWARKAAADWLEPFLGRNAPERVILTNGAQHGLSCALGAIARPGGVVLTDPVTYQGAAALCQSLGLTLTSVPMDDGGMIPEALEEACQRKRPAAVFLTPTLHNPLTLTLSADRRTALADVVRSHGSLILEDDVYRPLMPDAPDAIAMAHDDITIYISSLSKCAAPGVRFGVLSAPAHLVADITTMLRVNCWSTSPLTALIVTRMVETGQLPLIIEEQRRELVARHEVLAAIFQPNEIDMVRGAPHAWLKPPAPWRGDDFVRAAAQNGIGLLPGAAFAISRDKPPPDAARINIAATRSQAQLERAAQVLRRLMDTPPALANPLA